MAEQDQDQKLDSGQNTDTSYDELSLDGKGFSSLGDAEDNTLINNQDPMQEDAVHNANVQGPIVRWRIVVMMREIASRTLLKMTSML